MTSAAAFPVSHLDTDANVSDRALAAVSPSDASTAPSSNDASSPAASEGNPFEALGIGAPFVTTLNRLGITAPTPVQSEAIPVLLEGRDLIASAPTGTGKTAAFMLPALLRISTTEGRRGRGPRVLVLTPTRELAQQVAKAAQSFSAGLQRTTTVCITGGESYYTQNKLLSAPHEILVATPGRLMDQMKAGRIDLSRVDVLVLDEADRMLDMGFSEDVFAIAGAISPERQTVCFTATVSRSVRELAGQLLRDPHWLEVEHQVASNESIDQHVIYVDDLDHKRSLLQHCLNDAAIAQAIVFTATKRDAEQLARDLGDAGMPALPLHGDLQQRERNRTLNRLRNGDCRVLVATDVAARGIDVAAISHVFNFDLPRFAEDYVHRIGRTGRAGASGQAISFVGRDDVFVLRRIERFIGGPVQVSEIEGLEARFRPEERRGFGGGRPGGKRHGGKPGAGPRGGRSWGDGHGARGQGFGGRAPTGDAPAGGFGTRQEVPHERAGFAERRYDGAPRGDAPRARFDAPAQRFDGPAPRFDRGDAQPRGSGFAARTGFGGRQDGQADRGKSFGERSGGFGDRGNAYADRGNAGFGDRGNTFGDRGNGFGDRGNGFGRPAGKGFGPRGGGFGDRGARPAGDRAGQGPRFGRPARDFGR
ncbi:MAG TPA: DEAD/DEAH box helicase [Quisquiliibacterium sp.]|nr:DEAD/DEAH box helicase [Quisquiliibacterium sp.]